MKITPNIEVCSESLVAMLEYSYIERGLLQSEELLLTSNIWKHAIIDKIIKQLVFLAEVLGEDCLTRQNNECLRRRLLSNRNININLMMPFEKNIISCPSNFCYEADAHYQTVFIF